VTWLIKSLPEKEVQSQARLGLHGADGSCDLIEEIWLLVETSKNWWSGSYPNQFMFVMSAADHGLLLSEILPEGPGQRLECGVTALFRFRLPIAIPISSLRNDKNYHRMMIKAKGENLWRPRNVVALAATATSSNRVFVLGGLLNIDDLGLTTVPNDPKAQPDNRKTPIIEIPFWEAGNS